MLRLIVFLLLLATLGPLTGCQYICTDSRGEAYGRNWIPFGRRYRMCNKTHCVDGNGDHIDQRCSCSKKCSCWGPGTETADTHADAHPDAAEPVAPAGGCGCGA